MNQNDQVFENPEYIALSKKLEILRQECCFLRCILISDPDLNPFVIGENSTFLEKSLTIQKQFNEQLSTDRTTLLRELRQTKNQASNLFREVENLRDENDDLYNTIETITKEKGELNDELHSIQDDVDVTKQVINFLVNERDTMKKEIEVKDAKLMEYYQSVTRHGNYIITAQNPIPHVQYKGPSLFKR